jgi:hypothetical protein
MRVEKVWREVSNRCRHRLTYGAGGRGGGGHVRSRLRGLPLLACRSFDPARDPTATRLTGV